MENLSLTDLANKFGTDKGTEAFEQHGYSVIYEQLMSKLKYKNINLLEIGVYDGRFPCASVQMWYEYFPNAQIFGIDYDIESKKFENDRIHIFNGDQGNRNDLQTLIDRYEIKEFDIIIDDGSHFSRDHEISLGFLFPYLKSDGQYWIEDLHAPQSTQSLNNFKNSKLDNLTNTLINEQKYLVDNIQSTELFFDKLFLIFKK